MADDVNLSVKTFVLVDDLVRSGGTLIRCAEALRCEFGNDITTCAAVTHLAFDGGAERKFLNPATNPFKTFVAINTVARSRSLHGRGPFRLLHADYLLLDDERHRA